MIGVRIFLLQTCRRTVLPVTLMLINSSFSAIIPTTLAPATAHAAGFASASNASINDVPLPLGTVIQVVAQNTIHNGSLLSLATFESAGSLEGTTQFYRDVWPNPTNATIPALVETRAAGWLMLSHYDNGYNTVVQLRLAETEKSTGLLSVMSVNAAPGQPHEFMPDSLQLLSETQSNDAGIDSVLSVYASRESLNTVKRQLIQNWQSQNWVLHATHEYKQSHVLHMSRGSQRTEIVVSRDNTEGVLVVVNRINHRD